MKFIFTDHEAHVVVPASFKITPEIESMSDKEYENYDGVFELTVEVWGTKKVIATSLDFEPLRWLWKELVSEEEPITLEEAYERVRPLYRNQLKINSIEKGN